MAQIKALIRTRTSVPHLQLQMTLDTYIGTVMQIINYFFFPHRTGKQADVSENHDNHDFPYLA